jgi:hypothetical protein
MTSVPPDKWPEWRSEQNSKDQNKRSLVGGIERCLDDGITLISKRTIWIYSGKDLVTAASCLDQWATEGILEILAPLDKASDEENVIRMKAFIIPRKRRSGNWPTYPFGKPTLPN